MASRNLEHAFISTKSYRKPPGGQSGRGGPQFIEVEAGLDPRNREHGHGAYFTVTGSLFGRRFGNRQDYGGGCIHEEILRHWPKLAPIVRLHLSDESGAPMHAEANGWHSLVAAFGGCGEEYHAGNSDRHFPLPPERINPRESWKTTEYRKPTPDECLSFFAEHIRMSLEDARAVALRVLGDGWTLEKVRQCPRMSTLSRAEFRARWAAECDAMRPRWAAEAAAGIKLLDELSAKV